MVGGGDIYGADRGQKRASDPLELELQVTGAANRTWVHCKTGCALDHCAISPALESNNFKTKKDFGINSFFLSPE